MRLSLALIYAKDLDRMEGFYRDTLGLNPIESTRTDSWIEFDPGGIRFALHAMVSEIASTPSRIRENTPIKLTFTVEDIVRERARLESLGVTLIDRPWGGLDGVDPEGNVFGIAAR